LGIHGTRKNGGYDSVARSEKVGGKPLARKMKMGNQIAELTRMTGRN